jgi:hypothetical protein
MAVHPEARVGVELAREYGEAVYHGSEWSPV